MFEYTGEKVVLQLPEDIGYLNSGKNRHRRDKMQI
jgi:hypothetical protein